MCPGLSTHRVAYLRVIHSLGLTLAGLLAVASPLRAAEPLRPARAPAPPVIDGVLDDAVWQQAPSVMGFKTIAPDFGKSMADETTAYYAYDAANLYFAFRALDSAPAKIKASVASRDTIQPDDWVCINLDSFNDQQALYAFYVNPLGIQMDSRFTSGNEDIGFDAVWQSAARIDERGYTVEMRIPFKSIRYAGSERVTMGVIFERFVSRRSEHGMWPEMDPKAGMNILIQMHPIQFTGVERYTLVEALPDMTWGRQQAIQAGRLQTTSSAADFGITAKYGLTARLTADGTYNPDFSQVEADAGQIDVNLRAPLFFAEKRPFFLEGRELFNLGGPIQNLPLQAIVHTRTIENPRAGAKLSGKVSNRDTLALLYAADERPGSSSASDARYAHVAVLRYKRALDQDSYLGAFYTGREEGSTYNRVAGADGSIRIDPASAIGFYAFGSATGGPGRVSLGNGHAVGAQYARLTRNLDAGGIALDIGKTFVTDTGYLTRNGVATVGGWFAPMFYPSRGPVQRVQLAAESFQTRDAFSGLWETSNSAALQLLLRGAADLHIGCTPSTEIFEGQRFKTTACSASASKQVTKRLSIQGTASHGAAIYYSAQPFAGRSTRASASVVYQPSEQWSETLSATYASFDRAADGTRLYDYGILRSRTTYQPNRFLLFRGILEYNSFRRQVLTDLLASFTYIPGTVVHAGYGSLYERIRWDGERTVPGTSFVETRRGVFFKASYLWRM